MSKRQKPGKLMLSLLNLKNRYLQFWLNMGFYKILTYIFHIQTMKSLYRP